MADDCMYSMYFSAADALHINKNKAQRLNGFVFLIDSPIGFNPSNVIFTGAYI